MFLLPVVPNVCRDLGRCERTIKRWLKDPRMKMPQARRIRDRLYLVKSEYEQWKRDVLLTALDQGGSWKAEGGSAEPAPKAA